MHARLTILATLLALTSSAEASGKVFVVSPSGPFTQIQPAVDAASDDDVVLVATGNYAGFSIIDKSVSVVANAGANVAVAGPVSIAQLSPDRVVALVSLSISFSTSSLSDALTLRNNAGAVRLDNCTVNGANSGSGISNGTGAVEVRHSPDLALNQCTLRGGNGSMHPGGGLFLTSSSAAVFDSMLTGGNGGPKSDGGDCSANGGHNGITVKSGFAFASGSKLTGGNGADATTASLGLCAGCAAGGSGGNGLGFLSNAGAALLQCSTIGGNPGAGFGCGPNGSPGLAVWGNGAWLVPGLAKHLPALAPMHAGASTNLVLHGPAGGIAWLVRSTETCFRVRSNGVQLVEATAPPLLLGTFAPDGTLSVALSAANLGAGEEARVEFLQTAYFDHRWTLGPTTTLVTLDPAF